MTNVHSLKILDFNRMLAFYMRGYNKVCKSKCCKVGGVKKSLPLRPLQCLQARLLRFESDQI